MKKTDDDRKEFVQIGSIIDSVLSSYKRTPKSTVGRLNKIADIWSTVTGKTIADNTKPTAVKGKLLLVNVTSSVWVQQLQFIKNDLVLRLNASLRGEEIDDIKFKIGKV